MIDDDDRAQICSLYRAVARDLFAYAMVLTGGARAEAEDLVQLTFQALVQQWSQIRDRDHDSRRAWLWRVTANKAVSTYRQQARITAVDPLEQAAVLDRPQPGADLHHALLAHDLLDTCWAVICSMPPIRRLVITLAAYGESTSEIADRLGVTASTVRGHRAKAISDLTHKLGPVLTVLDVLDEHEGRRWHEHR
jgi:RNA polymerase sigma-70 factor (ECF subfamily)